MRTSEELSRYAKLMSQYSNCARLKVGCVIIDIDHNSILGVGFNGNPLHVTCDSDEPGKCGCVHAEERAIITCKRRYYEKAIYCTHLPCVMCAKRMILLGGVRRVVYEHDYRIRTSLEIFKREKIEVVKVESV